MVRLHQHLVCDLLHQHQKFDTLLVKSRFSRPGLLMNSRTYLNFQAQSIKCL